MRNILIRGIIRPKQHSFRLFGTQGLLTATFNSRPENKLAYAKERNKAGLFEVPKLQSAEDFHVIKYDCIQKTNLLIEEAVSKIRSRKMVEIFDELSDALCQVADLAEFIRIAHPSEVYSKAAEVASSTVSSIVESLNTNFKLYSALSEVVKNGDHIATNKMDDHVANLFLFDFEQSGIHLPKNERQMVVSLNNSILHIGQQFVTATGSARVVQTSLIPDNYRNFFTKDGDTTIVSGLYAHSLNEPTRELAYRIYLSHDKHQDQTLNEMLHNRHMLANICGFETYAHRALKGSTLENPEVVLDFLNCLSNGLKSRAENDFHIMTKMKQSENNSSKTLAAWDIPYFTNKAKKQLFNIESSEYSSYFSLGTCMEGLNNLLMKLYGISFVINEIKPGECWSQDIYKLGVTHETEGLLGYIYCDFYERSGKPHQDCHFTIRGGRALPDGSYQQPIVVLMLNLPAPNWSSPSLLTPSMVDNLFHEMGHALHSMLARTHYQHVTGTRCSTDFAEVPSVLMEYFAGDVRVLQTFARHFQTNQPMPDEMLKQLCASKRLFTASEMQIQVFYSVIDQLYHSKQPLNGSTTDVLAEAQAKYYGLPYVPDTSWQLRFSHLVGYGAKYYSYLVSRALASCIWQNYFQKDPFDRTQGERYRRECLSHGGSKPPRLLVADFLQNEPSTGLLTESLLNEIDTAQAQLKQVCPSLV